MRKDDEIVYVRDEVILPRRRQRRISFDWRNFLLIAGMSLLAVLGQLAQSLK